MSIRGKSAAGGLAARRVLMAATLSVMTGAVFIAGNAPAAGLLGP